MFGYIEPNYSICYDCAVEFKTANRTDSAPPFCCNKCSAKREYLIV